MESPFLNLHNQLQQIISEGSRSQTPTEEIIIFCFTQVRLLHILYVSMVSSMELDISGGIKDPNQYLFDIDKSRFDYSSFAYVLNQLGRILNKRHKKYNIKLPLYNRIRFFRNKVVEHWDDYVNNFSGASITKEKGKPLIPTICSVYSPEERIRLKKEIDAELLNFGITLELEEVGSLGERNEEKIYSVLERIDPSLCAQTKSGEYVISDRLVELLFKFGFPPPILDVKNYSEELVKIIISALKIPA